MLIHIFKKILFLQNENKINEKNETRVGCLLHFRNETKQNENIWHWNYVYELCKISPPYGKALVCALRCSKTLVDKIKEYALEYKNLFYY